MKIVQEEIFGPVVVMSVFDTEEEVIASANDSMYGLSSGLFTTNINRAHRVAHKLKAGTIWVNCFNELHPQVPFGGFKQSGECSFLSFRSETDNPRRPRPRAWRVRA